MTKIELVKPRRVVIRAVRCNLPLLDSAITMDFHWIECCGDLFLIQIGFGGVGGDGVISIVVFKLDFSTMAWDIVESCPNAAFFLGSIHQSMACPIAQADSDKLRNRVYYEKNEELYTYHIQNKTLSVSLLNIEIPALSRSPPYWIFIPQAQAEAEQDYCASSNRISSIEGAECFPFSSEGDNDTKSLLIVPNNEEEEVRLRTMLDDLPVDLLREIFLHLINPVDCLNFRAVSRLCRSVGSAKEWRRSRAFESGDDVFEGSFLSPWLMVTSLVKGGMYSMLDPIMHNQYNKMTPETFGENCRIRYSAYGWVLMSRVVGLGRLCVWLYNPMTKSILSLPEMPCVDYHFFLTSSPSCSDCQVVGISISASSFFFICPGMMTEWSEEDITQEGEDNTGIFMEEQSSNMYTVYLDGFFYFLGRNGSVGVLRCEEYGNILEVHQLKVPCRSRCYDQKFLVECDGVILCVYVGKGWKWLRVFALDLSEMIWEELIDLRGRNLYLSTFSSVMVKDKTPEMRNRIYFPRTYQDSILYYSFKTCKFHCSNSREEEEEEEEEAEEEEEEEEEEDINGEGSEDSEEEDINGEDSEDSEQEEEYSEMSYYYGSKEQLCSCWFEPRWSYCTTYQDQELHNNE